MSDEINKTRALCPELQNFPTLKDIIEFVTLNCAKYHLVFIQIHKDFTNKTINFQEALKIFYEVLALFYALADKPYRKLQEFEFNKLNSNDKERVQILLKFWHVINAAILSFFSVIDSVLVGVDVVSFNDGPMSLDP